MKSCSSNSGPENVRVRAVVVAELKLRDIQREIFAADLVVAAHDPALKDRPETSGFCQVRDNRRNFLELSARVPADC